MTWEMTYRIAANLIVYALALMILKPIGWVWKKVAPKSAARIGRWALARQRRKQSERWHAAMKESIESIDGVRYLGGGSAEMSVADFAKFIEKLADGGTITQHTGPGTEDGPIEFTPSLDPKARGRVH